MLAVHRLGLSSLLVTLTLAGSGSNAAAQASARGPALRLHSGGLDAILADGRDAGLKRALSMLDERLLELAREHAGSGPPPEVWKLLLGLVKAPYDFTLDIVEGGDWSAAPPIRAQLAVPASDPAAAEAFAQHFDALLHGLLPFPTSAAPDRPGLQVLELPVGKLFYGAPKASSSFLLSFGEPRADAAGGAAAKDSFGLPPGVEPALALELDMAALRAPLEMMLALRGGQAGLLRAQLENLGLIGEHPIGIRFALGQAPDRLQLATRLRNWVPLARANGALVTQPLTRDELRLIPVDATSASVAKADLALVFDTFLRATELERAEVLAQVQSALGIDLVKDVLEPVGTTTGFYLSDTTGGGGLASLVAFTTIDDEARLAQALDKAVAALEKQANDEQAPVRVRRWEHAGASCRSLTFPGLPIPVEPSFALAHGVLLLAATPQGLSAALDQALGKAPGLVAHPAFRALAPAQSLDDLVALRFTDTPRLLGSGYGWAGLLCSALANGVRSATDPEREPGLVLPPYKELAAGARALILFSRIAGDDLVTVGEGDRSALSNLTALLGGATPVVGLVFAGSLATLVVPNVVRSLSVANVAKAKADIMSICFAIDSYAIENDGRYPESLDALVEPDASGHSYLQVETMPLDPWKNPYCYEPAPPGSQKYRVISYGRDGMPGGAGDDADIDNWLIMHGER